MLRIGLTDAPAVLGWQAWREFEARHGLGMITAQLERARAAGLIAITEAALIVAYAADPATARAQAQQALLTLISGIVRT